MNYFSKFISSRLQKAQSSKLEQARRVAIQEADSARDSGDPARAAILYGAVIERWGAEFGLLVQHGNALKDSRDFRRAEEVYQSALQIRPNDADCLLQLGHLMKLAGDPSRAEQFYREANRIDPTSDDILVELRTIEAKRAAEAQQAANPSIEPALAATVEPQVDRGSRPLIIRQRIMNELARRRN